MSVCVRVCELRFGFVFSCGLEGLSGCHSLWMGEGGTYWTAMDELRMDRCLVVVEKRIVE